ncbi:MAG: phosphatase PAP2 family protein [Burkholderiales bacterium]|nr:phosphatase PAP2 family protein [Burkholderiales bacterium]
MHDTHAARDTRLAWATAALLTVLLAWELSGLDMALARLSGGAAGFVLRDHWLLANLLHEGGRRLSWAAALLLCLGVWWPMGWLRQLPLAQRLQLAAGTLAAVAAVAMLKSINATSCPWDLADFGGLARYIPHWVGFRLHDGGVGHCFPAGHASAGFAFVNGYFAFRRHAPALARRWLLLSLAAGLVFGLGQQLRGAHFMSHTLWTGALCWLVAWMVDLAWMRAGARRIGMLAKHH